ncbi:MAG: hypothetical protein JXP34_17350, partial [Planctomycetes bacterium]|nr:hypothetical protein [Planctomycetota bacterium]
MRSGLASLVLCLSLGAIPSPAAEVGLEQGFARPPASARPWVYWFWMDGNLSREGITADLEAMARAGIGGVIIMEVDVGIPRGPVAFMGPRWRELFAHVAAEAARLGLEIDLNASPGWTGSGGPWIKPEQSMQTVAFSERRMAGPRRFDAVLPQPPAKEGFYRDIAVLAFPAPAGDERIPDIAEKALYARGHYSSEPGVRSWIPVPARPAEPAAERVIAKDRMIDLTGRMDDSGRLTWDVPAGEWIAMRFGRTSTGANTRPAPLPGLGLECDKLDAKALEAHFDAYIGTLMRDIGPLTGKSLTSLHIDSWEMGPQNWTAAFPEEFRRRRGYDPIPYLPVLSGRVVGGISISERFLWDLRQTVAELILENYAGRLRDLAHRHGMRLSIEPYDGTPCDDLTLGARADVPMCEFWSDTFDTTFSCTQASSIAHVYGRSIVAAEAFTAGSGERWLRHPGNLKALGDWAFCQGVNRFVFHRYAHQPWLDRRPGMTMGPYGIHYERTQTWWDFTPAYHDYLGRCQFLLQQGLWVADICYLAPQGAPHVFRPPTSARRGDPPDRLGYNFDGCTPEALLERAMVRDGRIVFPDGMRYRLLVLPDAETMTPALLRKIADLVRDGAAVLGSRPLASPSLSDYPSCDDEVRRIGGELWGDGDPPAGLTAHSVGKGRMFRSGAGPKPRASEEDPSKALAGSTWIWYDEGEPAVAAPVGARHFRRIVDVDANAGIDSARLVITADNAFEAWVNGSPAGSGNNFTRAGVLDVSKFVRPGRNILAVTAVNGAETPNPAGLIATLAITLRDGRALTVRTDRAWTTATVAEDGWRTDPEAAEGWSPARALGPMGMSPWGAIRPIVSYPDLYPEYGLAARILEEMGVPPDFEADAELRYAHRRAGETDIYFVANPEDRWIGASCTFRVTGKAPELWDPMTGRITKPAIREERDSRTRLPLRLGPTDSVFVVFRRREGANVDPVAGLRRDGRDILPEPGAPVETPPAVEVLEEGSGVRLLAFEPGRYELRKASGTVLVAEIPSLPAPLEIRGPWQVRFEPGRGAPEKATFDRLLD